MAAILHPRDEPGPATGSESLGRRWRPVRLRAKFLVWLGLVFLAFGAITAGLIYAHERRQLEESALGASRLVMASVDATRAYVRNTLRPRMYDMLGKDAFVLEAMSTSYVSREVMDNFNRSLPEYRFRRVALLARNPASEPNPMERDLIEHFRRNPRPDQWQGMQTLDGTMCFVHALPVYMEASCLNCHGDPREAPQELVAQYGDRRGFGYRAGDLAGIMAVSIPVDVALLQIRDRALSVFWVTLMMFSGLFLVISLLFDQMVVRSLRGLLEVFRGSLMDEREHALLQEASAKGEIDELAEAAHVLTDHLQTARRELARYAEELEQRVTERTKDLEASRRHLHEKVTARNLELQTLNRIAELITRSFRLADILPGVLDQTLELIPATGAAIYLLHGDSENARLHLECHRNADKLDALVTAEDTGAPEGEPASLPEAIWQAYRGQMNMFACRRHQGCLNVPLICRERVLGVMTFVGVGFSQTAPEMRALLQSIGQQIGITVESLRNMSAVLQSKDLLQSVFDGIPDCMVLLDRELTVRMVNRAFLERHSCRLSEVIGRPCGEVGGCGEDHLAGRLTHTAIATQRQVREEVCTPAGEIFDVTHYPIADEGGQVQGVLRYARDVTLQKQVEQRIQQTEKLAALGQLAAGVAHEINNPMGVILCYTELLRRVLDGDGQSLKDLETIEKQALTCQRIVSDLLNFARSRSVEQRPGNLNATLGEVVEMLRQQFRKQGTDIEVHLEDNLPPLPFDEGQLKQVFLNLLMNAHQAVRHRAGQITVRTRLRGEDDVAEVVVRDNGTGIPREIADRIFDPFFSTKGTGEGTGLGLSVSYGIVRDHGGEIRMASEPGAWTEFVVRLPLGTAQALVGA